MFTTADDTIIGDIRNKHHLPREREEERGMIQATQGRRRMRKSEIKKWKLLIRVEVSLKEVPFSLHAGYILLRLKLESGQEQTRCLSSGSAGIDKGFYPP